MRETTTSHARRVRPHGRSRPRDRRRRRRATGTVALTAPVAGLYTGDPPSTSTRSPFTKWGIDVMVTTFLRAKSTGRVSPSR